MDLKRRKVSQAPSTNTLVVKAAVQRSPLEQKWGRWNVDEWRYEISIPGGMIQETTDVFLYRPPAEGYSNAISSAFVKTGGTIRMRDKKSIYVRFASGEYGGGRIEVWADRSGDNALVRLDLKVNLDGSRNLERDPYAQPPQHKPVIQSFE